MRKTILISLTVLAIAACNSQGEKRNKTAKAEPAEKLQPAAASNQPLTKNITPAQPTDKAPPPMERSVPFLPPVITEEPHSDNGDDFENFGAASLDYDFAPVEGGLPPPPPPVEIEEPLAFVDDPPTFPGGTAAMKKYISGNLKYPQSAVDEGTEGKVFVKFIVSKDGTISNVTVIKNLPGCPECDKEAVRLVKAMPKWTPGKAKGKAADSYFTLPVPFKLQ